MNAHVPVQVPTHLSLGIKMSTNEPAAILVTLKSPIVPRALETTFPLMFLVYKK